MRKIILSLAIVSCFYSVSAKADTLDQLDELEWAHESERNNYIEFGISQIIFTKDGILVITDNIYKPDIIGFDKEEKCYYMLSNSTIIHENLIKNNVLIREIKRIKKYIR